MFCYIQSHWRLNAVIDESNARDAGEPKIPPGTLFLRPVSLPPRTSSHGSITDLLAFNLQFTYL